MLLGFLSFVFLVSSFHWLQVLIYFFFFLLFYCSSTVVFIFFHHSHPSHPSCLPPSNLPSLALSMCPLYKFLDDTSPIFPHYPSPCSPLVTVSLLFISMSLVIFCLLVFCWLGSTYRWDHIVFVFTTGLISLSIMLSRSIHAFRKGGSSFFLSAA